MDLLTGPTVQNKRRGVLAALAMLMAWSGVAGPVRAADSMLTWKGTGQPLIIYHAYSASDGRTYIEEIPVPPEIKRSATSTALLYFDVKPEALRVAQSKSGDMIDWHYAGDSRHLIVPLQGDTVFETGDGKVYHVKAGEAILAEDWTGKGHRSGCLAVDKQSCLVFDILLGPNPKSLPPPPAH